MKSDIKSMRFAIALDIGGTSIRAAIVNSRGEIVLQSFLSVPVNSQETAGEILSSFVNPVRHLPAPDKRMPAKILFSNRPQNGRTGPIYRDKEFCLPATDIRRVTISNVEDALNIGATAILVRYIMGMEDEFEAENVRSISLLARSADRNGLPVIVEICPTGDQIRGKNFDAIVKLGVACMLEAGVDGLIVPPCSPDVLREIGDWADIPLILKTDELPALNQLESVFTTGFAGILLSEAILGKSDFIADLANLYNRIHS